jgi:sialic acid synthase SpsE
MLGNPERPIGESEARERVFARRGVYAKEDLKRGQKVSPRQVSYLRPRLGIGVEEFGSLKKKRLNTDVSKGKSLDQDMFE